MAAVHGTPRRKASAPWVVGTTAAAEPPNSLVATPVDTSPETSCRTQANRQGKPVALIRVLHPIPVVTLSRCWHSTTRSKAVVPKQTSPDHQGPRAPRGAGLCSARRESPQHCRPTTVPKPTSVCPVLQMRPWVTFPFNTERPLLGQIQDLKDDASGIRPSLAPKSEKSRCTSSQRALQVPTVTGSLGGVPGASCGRRPRQITSRIFL